MLSVVLSFLLGVIIGIAISALMVCTLAYFRRPVERVIETVTRTLEQAGPKAKGFIFEPDDDATEARNEIIEKNRKEGRDTKLSELL